MSGHIYCALNPIDRCEACAWQAIFDAQLLRAMGPSRFRELKDREARERWMRSVNAERRLPE